MTGMVSARSQMVRQSLSGRGRLERGQLSADVVQSADDNARASLASGLVMSSERSRTCVFLGFLVLTLSLLNDRVESVAANCKDSYEWPDLERRLLLRGSAGGRWLKRSRRLVFGRGRAA
jgi:hypothetical protein